MNDDSRAVPESYTQEQVNGPVTPEPQLAGVPAPPEIPDYLQETYWWAYLHPKALKFFEREWMVNLILWGNMNRLTQAVIGDLDVAPGSEVLQVACVYGDFSNKLARHLDGSGSRLGIVDVAPIQLKNAREKLAGNRNVDYHHQDSTEMAFEDGRFDDIKPDAPRFFMTSSKTDSCAGKRTDSWYARLICRASPVVSHSP